MHPDVRNVPNKSSEHRASRIRSGDQERPKEQNTRHVFAISFLSSKEQNGVDQKLFCGLTLIKLLDMTSFCLVWWISQSSGKVVLCRTVCFNLNLCSAVSGVALLGVMIATVNYSSLLVLFWRRDNFLAAWHFRTSAWDWGVNLFTVTSCIDNTSIESKLKTGMLPQRKFVEQKETKTLRCVAFSPWMHNPWLANRLRQFGVGDLSCRKHARGSKRAGNVLEPQWGWTHPTDACLAFFTIILQDLRNITGKHGSEEHVVRRAWHVLIQYLVNFENHRAPVGQAVLPPTTKAMSCRSDVFRSRLLNRWIWRENNILTGVAHLLEREQGFHEVSLVWMGHHVMGWRTYLGRHTPKVLLRFKRHVLQEHWRLTQPRSLFAGLDRETRCGFYFFHSCCTGPLPHLALNGIACVD